MASDPLQSRADALAARIEALAAALRAGGVPDAASSRLLSHASAAALQALTLELLLAEQTDPPVAEEPVPRTPREAGVPRAA